MPITPSKTKSSSSKERSIGDTRNVVQLRNKKNKAKSLSQLVNEQWDESVEGHSSEHRDRFHEDGFGDEEAMVEDYEVVPSDPFLDGEEETGGKGGYQHFIGNRKREREADSKKKKMAISKGEPQLRRRGPLDATLSTGKYAAVPRDVEAAMDDLFGGLDMADLDEEANEIVSDIEGYSAEESDAEASMDDRHRKTTKRRKGGAKKRGTTDEEGSDVEEEEEGQRRRKEVQTKKKSKKVKDLTEAQYIAYVEQKAHQSGARKEGGGGEAEEEEEEDDDEKRLPFRSLPKTRRGLDPGLVTSSETAEEAQEMEENDLLSQIASLRSQHIRVVQSGTSADGESESRSGNTASAEAPPSSIRQTVKHFLLLHTQLLRLRVKLQPMVMRAVRLPQHYALPLFTGSGQEALFQKEATEPSSELGSSDRGNGNEEGKRTRQQKSKTKEKKSTEKHTLRVDTSTTKNPTEDPSWEEVRQRLATAKKDFQYLKKEMKHLLSDLYADAIQMHDGSEKASTMKTSFSRPSAAASTVCPDMHMLSAYHRHVRENANTCLDFWGCRLAPSPSSAAPSAFKAIHQPLPAQIEALLQNKSRLRVKVQKNRSHVSILGHPEHVRAASWFYKEAPKDVEAGEEGNTAMDSALAQTQRDEWRAKRATSIANGDVDEEMYDDGDFIRELARRGGAVSMLLQQQLEEDRQAMLGDRSGENGRGGSDTSSRALGGASGSKKGFHRLTKGKSLDFAPRPKLVGFMVADSWENLYPPRNEAMVRSLLQ